MSTSENSLPLTGGPRPQNAPVLQTRTNDLELYEALSHGEYCLVLTPPEIGKLARVRAAARLREEGAAVVVLHLAAFGEHSTTEAWYKALLTDLGRQLGLQPELEQFWQVHDRLSALQRWMAALREVAMEKAGVGSWAGAHEVGDGVGKDQTESIPNSQLPTPNPRLIIFLDELEAVRDLPFSVDEFFAAIRECYNRRTQDAEFHRLTFCLLGAVRLNDLIRDARTTAFNIGRRIDLSDPSEADLASPTPGSRRRRKVAVLVKRAVDWISGEPYAFRIADLGLSSPRG